MNKYFKLNENKILIITIACLGLIAFFVAKPSTSQEPNESYAEYSIDTVIPAGYVLVPIQLANAEPLSSLVGMTSVVDLFSTSADGLSKSKKIASKLKLIRAPKNPLLYAVLVRDSESEKILAQPGPYFAVIQNHQQNGGEIKQAQKNQVEISYQR